jgi:magnesium chelatase subunit D
LVVRQDWNAELALLCGLVRAAREQLPSISITAEQIEQLAAAALVFGVEGHRADLFATYAACASAALALHDTVEQEDLELAVRLVILPRATRIPQPPAEPPRLPARHASAKSRSNNFPNAMSHAEQ